VYNDQLIIALWIIRKSVIMGEQHGRVLEVCMCECTICCSSISSWIYVVWLFLSSSRVYSLCMVQTIVNEPAKYVCCLSGFEQECSSRTVHTAINLKYFQINYCTYVKFNGYQYRYNKWKNDNKKINHDAWRWRSEKRLIVVFVSGWTLGSPILQPWVEWVWRRHDIEG
jgi:hypothetical protein